VWRNRSRGGARRPKSRMIWRRIEITEKEKYEDQRSEKRGEEENEQRAY